MGKLTKIGLIDSCIDGDREKFDYLFGPMYDQFSCFFSLLRENGVAEIPKTVSFSKKVDVAEFDISANLLLDNKEKTLSIFDCKIAVTPSKQTTNVNIQRKQ